MTFTLNSYIDFLTTRHSAIESIWLIGSRANGTDLPTSDWDIVAFSGDQLLSDLSADKEIHLPEVDLLVVLSDLDTFERPWGESKSGSLSGWSWTQTGSDTATYIGTKWVPDQEEVAGGWELGEVVSSELRALLVWP